MVVSPWFPYYHADSEAKTLLFCFSHSGGAASSFRNWQAYFHQEIEVVPVQLPGREGRFKESFLTSMCTLIDELLRHMLIFVKKRLIFFGHSLGGLIAYELAKKIHADNLTLIVSSCSAPHLLTSTTQLHRLPNDKFIQQVARYGGFPQAILESPEALQILCQRLKADFEIFETYQFAPALPLNIPIFAFGGSSDKVVPQENLLEWEKYTTASFKRYFFEGGHFYPQTNSQKICFLIEKIQRGSDG